MIENLYLWVGIAVAILIGTLLIYFSVQTSKKRAREVEELNQHFPDRSDPPISLENLKNRRSLKDELEGESPMEKERPREMENAEKPIRYRRSIFHPDHLKTEQDESVHK